MLDTTASTVSPPTFAVAPQPRPSSPSSPLSLDPDAPVPSDSDHLFAALYLELHRLAEHHLRRGGGEISLTPTTLLHEAYLGLAERPDLAFPDRASFLGYAARAMRGLVIDYVRRSRAQKRGGGAFEITLDAEVAPTREAARQSEELTRLSDAVDELGRLEPSLAELVDLHFFCGYTFAEIAGMRGVSERTVQRDWQKARLLLHHALLEETPGSPQS